MSTSGLFVHTEKYTKPHGHTHSNKYKVIGSDSECGCESWQAEAVGRHRATVSLAWGAELNGCGAAGGKSLLQSVCTTSHGVLRWNRRRRKAAGSTSLALLLPGLQKPAVPLGLATNWEK